MYKRVRSSEKCKDQVYLWGGLKEKKPAMPGRDEQNLSQLDENVHSLFAFDSKWSAKQSVGLVNVLRNVSDEHKHKVRLIWGMFKL